MSKVILRLTDGQLFDAEGTFVATPVMSIKYFEAEEAKNTVVELVKLGVTPSDIIDMKRADLI